MYARIALPVPLDKTFTYTIPPGLSVGLALGQRVRVPFGRGRAVGFVVGFEEESPVSQVKEILDFVDPEPLASQEILDLTQRVARECGGSWGEVLAVAVPGYLGRAMRRRRGTGKPQRAQLECGFPFRLNLHQLQALTPIREAIERSQHQVFLLHGVTGSGKTEVYLQAIEKIVSQGRQALVLVPEISLTPQAVERYRERFPRTGIWHSGLSQGERSRTWMACRSGEVDILIGVRSAVFLPFPDLGIIVVDEEHERTYKQWDQSPRYHAREVAQERARIKGIPLILGSATPSLESYYRAKEGAYRLLELPERIGGRPLAKVDILDLRRERGKVFSYILSGKIRERLDRGEQVVLFLNRRGYAPFVQCQECGFVYRCPKCQVSLTYHAGKRILWCHYCGKKEPEPRTCRGCKGVKLSFRGIGTEQVERETRRLFPEARWARLDSDTAGRKGVVERTLERFGKGEVQILIGTQMIAKGMDNPKVTLVGVISADTVLALPDFRAAERTFQLLTQVAGRAGRGTLPGEVCFQTYLPEHYAVQAAKEQDYQAFYDQELALRKEVGYPPFVRLAKISVPGQTGERAASLLAERFGEKALGPVLQTKGKTTAWEILIKGNERLPDAVRQAVRELTQEIEYKKVRVQVDIDPEEMF
jgi:primosomal protein N' (replication factor Y)